MHKRRLTLVEVLLFFCLVFLFGMLSWGKNRKNTLRPILTFVLCIPVFPSFLRNKFVYKQRAQANTIFFGKLTHMTLFHNLYVCFVSPYSCSRLWLLLALLLCQRGGFMKRKSCLDFLTRRRLEKAKNRKQKASFFPRWRESTKGKK